jgi:hypothetical protein
LNSRVPLEIFFAPEDGRLNSSIAQSNKWFFFSVYCFFDSYLQALFYGLFAVESLTYNFVSDCFIALFILCHPHVDR